MRTLTAIPLTDLNKLRIQRVVLLHTFMNELSTNAASHHAAGRSVVLTDGVHSAERKHPVSNAAAKQSVNQSFLDQVVEFLRGTFEAIGSLGESPVTDGEVWEASLDAAGRVVDRKRIGQAGDLSWPVRAFRASSCVWMSRNKC
jgi:hypothetical protein